ncbi:HNH endonuclease [Fodinisporobacter ferrooxydans]
MCGGYLHKNSISIDHVVRRQDGGTNAADNAQLAHPYCNSSIKN